MTTRQQRTDILEYIEQCWMDDSPTHLVTLVVDAGEFDLSEQVLNASPAQVAGYHSALVALMGGE